MPNGLIRTASDVNRVCRAAVIRRRKSGTERAIPRFLQRMSGVSFLCKVIVMCECCRETKCLAYLVVDGVVVAEADVVETAHAAERSEKTSDA